MREGAAGFDAPWWLRHAHVQTVVPAFDPRRFTARVDEVRYELPDGDFLDVHWLNRESTGPVFIVLPGMQGTPRSSYVRHLLWMLSRRGLRAAVLCHRGAAVPNRVAGFYHAGFTEQLAWFIGHLQASEPQTPRYAIGYSLGGSMLVRHLACTGHRSGLRAAAAVSLAFSLQSTARLGNTGINRIYQRRVLGSYKRAMQAKAHMPEIARRLHALRSLRSIEAFDAAFTAPIHGFRDLDDYYGRCSSRQFLPCVEVPLLIVNAIDDPLIDRATLPEPRELRKHISLELTPCGGHLGFVCRRSVGGYYLPSRLLDFLQNASDLCHESLLANAVGDDLLFVEADDARRRSHEHPDRARPAERPRSEHPHEQRALLDGL